MGPTQISTLIFFHKFKGSEYNPGSTFKTLQNLMKNMQFVLSNKSRQARVEYKKWNTSSFRKVLRFPH